MKFSETLPLDELPEDVKKYCQTVDRTRENFRRIIDEIFFQYINTGVSASVFLSKYIRGGLISHSRKVYLDKIVHLRYADGKGFYVANDANGSSSVFVSNLLEAAKTLDRDDEIQAYIYPVPRSMKSVTSWFKDLENKNITFPYKSRQKNVEIVEKKYNQSGYIRLARKSTEKKLSWHVFHPEKLLECILTDLEQGEFH